MSHENPTSRKGLKDMLETIMATPKTQNSHRCSEIALKQLNKGILNGHAIIQNGELLKKGEFNKSAKSRYFVLTSNFEMYYFSSSTDTVSLGVINLKEVLAVSAVDVADPLLIKLVTLSRVWYLGAANEEDKEKWVNALGILPPFEVLNSDWMVKRGDFIRSWKQRYFTLTNSFIFYFENESSSHKFVGNVWGGKSVDGLSKGSISLENAVVKDLGLFENQEHVLSIDVKNASSGELERTFYLQVPNSKICQKWVEAIQHAIDNLHDNRVNVLRHAVNLTTKQNVSDSDANETKN